MAVNLSNQQMNDSIYLQNMINNLTAQRTNLLRQNEMNTQQNMRKLREATARNGIGGGFEESNYARLLAGQNAARADIDFQYSPDIAQYQSYLDRLRALQAASVGGGGGGGGKKKSSSSSYSSYDPAWDLSGEYALQEKLARKAYDNGAAYVPAPSPYHTGSWNTSGKQRMTGQQR